MKCSACGSIKLKPIESHKSFTTLADDIQRRRYRCQCGHSESIYVVTKALLEDYKDLKMRARLAAEMLTGLTQTLKQCSSCSFWDHDSLKCSLGFPEAGGTFAEECSSYLSDNGGHF